jgi:hypothetical protein
MRLPRDNALSTGHLGHRSPRPSPLSPASSHTPQGSGRSMPRRGRKSEASASRCLGASARHCQEEAMFFMFAPCLLVSPKISAHITYMDLSENRMSPNFMGLSMFSLPSGNLT